MGCDPTQAYFWPVGNERPTHLWSGNFLTQPKEKKIEKFEIFRGVFPNPDGWPDSSNKKLNRPDLDQKILTRVHHQSDLIHSLEIKQALVFNISYWLVSYDNRGCPGRVARGTWLHEKRFKVVGTIPCHASKFSTLDCKKSTSSCSKKTLNFKKLNFFQSLLTSTSRHLFDTTSGRGYFSDITIILPRSWQTTECLIDITLSTDLSTIGKRNIIVRASDPLFGAQPLARQYGQCGVQGLWMDIPIDALTSEKSLTKQTGILICVKVIIVGF